MYITKIPKAVKLLSGFFYCGLFSCTKSTGLRRIRIIFSFIRNWVIGSITISAASNRYWYSYSLILAGIIIRCGNCNGCSAFANTRNNTIIINTGNAAVTGRTYDCYLTFRSVNIDVQPLIVANLDRSAFGFQSKV